MKMFFSASTALIVASASEILVSLKGTTPKCFGEELANNELLVLKADIQSPPSAQINLYVFSGIAEVGEVLTKKVDKKNIVFQESKRSQIGTALTSASVSFSDFSCLFSGRSALDLRRKRGKYHFCRGIIINQVWRQCKRLFSSG